MSRPDVVEDMWEYFYDDCNFLSFIESKTFKYIAQNIFILQHNQYQDQYI